MHAFGGHQAPHESNHRASEPCSSRSDDLAWPKSVRNGRNARELQQTAKPLRGSDVRGHQCTEEAPHKGEQRKLPGRKPALRRIAAQTLVVPCGHEMTRAWRALRFNEELAVRTNGLETVMFHDDWPSCQQTQDYRSECRASDLDDVRRANETPEWEKARLANYSKRKRAVVITSQWSLSHQRNFKFATTFGIPQFSKPTSKKQNGRLNATDARGKIVRINGENHSDNFP